MPKCKIHNIVYEIICPECYREVMPDERLNDGRVRREGIQRL